MTLDGYLTCNGDGTGTSHLPRGVYWASRAYAALSGDLVKVTPETGVDGLASFNRNDSTIQLLVGNYGKVASQLEISFENLSGFTSAHVSVFRIINSGQKPSTPVLLQDTTMAVTNSMLNLVVQEVDVQPQDAINVLLNKSQ